MPRGNPNWKRGGKSPNPGGRPKEIGEVKELARGYTVEAIEGLVKIARDKKAPAAAKVAAWNGVLDRGWGRPTQPVKDEDGKPADPMEAMLAFVASRKSVAMAAGMAAANAEDK